MNAKGFRDVKHCFDTPEIYALYAHCMYMPTWEKFYERAKNYKSDGRTGMFVYEEGDRAAGVIAVRR